MYENPAFVYIQSLSSGDSQRRAIQIMNDFAVRQGYRDLHTYPWAQLSSAALEQYRQELLMFNFASRTINARVSALKIVAKQAWLQRLLSVDEFLKILSMKPLVVGEVGTEVAMPEQKNSLQDALSIRNEAICTLSESLGLSALVLSRLRLSMIDRSFRMIRLPVRTTVSYRNITVPDDVWETLDRWLECRGNKGVDNLFVVIRRGNHMHYDWPLSRNAISYVLRIRKKFCDPDSSLKGVDRYLSITPVLDEGLKEP